MSSMLSFNKPLSLNLMTSETCVKHRYNFLEQIGWQQLLFHEKKFIQWFYPFCKIPFYCSPVGMCLRVLLAFTKKARVISACEVLVDFETVQGTTIVGLRSTEGTFSEKSWLSLPGQEMKTSWSVLQPSNLIVADRSHRKEEEEEEKVTAGAFVSY